MKSAESLIQHSNPGVRNEAIGFYKEVALWIGLDPIRPFIDKLKKQQIEEIEKHVEGKDKPRPTRYTRDEAEAKKAEALNEAINNACAEEEEQKVDAFDLSEP